MKLIAANLIVLLAWGGAALSQTPDPRPGWVIMPTQKSHSDLVDAVKDATKANGMGVVTEAGPTAMAAKRGITIPQNRVIGVFNNDFAVKILELSVAAMIEAPIRIYVTENADGTGTLSYKTPTFVFSPYADEGGTGLTDLAAQLDEKFAVIVEMASQ